MSSDGNPVRQREKNLARIREHFGRGDVVILDTETTGHKQAEVIEIAVIDLRGRVLFDELIRPRRMEMNRYAERVHGIKLGMLKDRPRLPELLPVLEPILRSSLVLAWNSGFDALMIERSCRIWELEPIPFEHECAMRLYAGLHGRSSYALHDAIADQGLDALFREHRSHRALGDVRLVRELLRSSVAGVASGGSAVTLP